MPASKYQRDMLNFWALLVCFLTSIKTADLSLSLSSRNTSLEGLLLHQWLYRDGRKLQQFQDYLMFQTAPPYVVSNLKQVSQVQRACTRLLRQVISSRSRFSESTLLRPSNMAQALKEISGAGLLRCRP